MRFGIWWICYGLIPNIEKSLLLVIDPHNIALFVQRNHFAIFEQIHVLGINITMFQLQTQRVYNKGAQSQGDTYEFIFEGQIHGYIYGVTGFNFSYPVNDHDIAVIKVTFEELGYNGDKLSLRVNFMMEDNYQLGGRHQISNRSFVDIAVLALMDSNNIVYLDRLRPIPVGTTSTGLPAANYAQQVMISGFNFSYGKGDEGSSDNRVKQLRTFVSFQGGPNPQGELDVVSSAKISPNDQATTDTTPNMMRINKSDTGIRIITRKAQSAYTQVIQPGTGEDEAPVFYQWAMFLQGFNFKFPKEDTHCVRSVVLDTSYEICENGDIRWGASASWNDDTGNKQEDYSDNNPDGSSCDVVFIGWQAT